MHYNFIFQSTLFSRYTCIQKLPKNNAISSHSNGSIIIAIIRIIKNIMLLGGGREGMDHHLWWCCCCRRDFTFFNDEWRKILYGLFFRIRYLQAVYLNGIINHNLCYGGDFLTNSDDFGGHVWIPSNWVKNLLLAVTFW